MTEQPPPVKLHSILERLLPQSDAARKITLLMFLPVALAYGGRIFINQWLEYNRGGGNIGFLAIIVCPVLCLIGAIMITFIVGLALLSAQRAHHLAPALILVGGIVFIPFLPLPPLPIPVFPEQDFFSAHRAEFEQVVTLARQNKLKCPERGCEYLGRYLPSNYAHLSISGVVDVTGSQSDLTVQFRPLEFYYPIVYFDVIKDKNSFWYYECQEGRWVRKLDDHWYTCVVDD